MRQGCTSPQFGHKVQPWYPRSMFPWKSGRPKRQRGRLAQVLVNYQPKGRPNYEVPSNFRSGNNITRPRVDYFAVRTGVSTLTRAGEKLVESTKAVAPVLAGEPDAGVAIIGERVVGGLGPSGVVCHGTEVISDTDRVDVI